MGCLAKILVGTVSLVVVLVLMSFGLYYAAGRYLPELASDLVTQGTGFPTSVDSVDLNLGSAEVSFSDVQVRNPGNFAEGMLLDETNLRIQFDTSGSDPDRQILKEVEVEIGLLGLSADAANLTNLAQFREAWSKLDLRPDDGASGLEKNWRIDHLSIRIDELLRPDGTSSVVGLEIDLENVDTVETIFDGLSRALIEKEEGDFESSLRSPVRSGDPEPSN